MDSLQGRFRRKLNVIPLRTPKIGLHPKKVMLHNNLHWKTPSVQSEVEFLIGPIKGMKQ